MESSPYSLQGNLANMNRVDGRDDSQVSLGMRGEGSPPTPRSLRLMPGPAMVPPTSLVPGGGSVGGPSGGLPSQLASLTASSEDLRRYTHVPDHSPASALTPGLQHHPYSPGYCIWCTHTTRLPKIQCRQVEDIFTSHIYIYTHTSHAEMFLMSKDTVYQCWAVACLAGFRQCDNSSVCL